MIDRRAFITAVTGGMLIPRRGAAQPARIARIGVLTGASEAGTPKFEAFRQGLRDLGYVEGQNVALEFRFARTTYLVSRSLTHTLKSYVSQAVTGITKNRSG